MLNQESIDLIKKWVDMDGGDKERTACFMRDSLAIGGIRSCRELINDAYGYSVLYPGRRTY